MSDEQHDHALNRREQSRQIRELTLQTKRQILENSKLEGERLHQAVTKGNTEANRGWFAKLIFHPNIPPVASLMTAIASLLAAIITVVGAVVVAVLFYKDGLYRIQEKLTDLAKSQREQAEEQRDKSQAEAHQATTELATLETQAGALTIKLGGLQGDVRAERRKYEKAEADVRAEQLKLAPLQTDVAATKAANDAQKLLDRGRYLEGQGMSLRAWRLKSNDATVRAVTEAYARPIATINAKQSITTSWSPDDRLIATTTIGNGVQVWNIMLGRIAGTETHFQAKPQVRYVTESGRQELLVAANGITLLDAEGMRTIPDSRPSPKVGSALDVSVDGRLSAWTVSSEKQTSIMVWDRQEGRMVLSKALESAPTSARLSPYDNYLLTEGQNQHLWEIKSGTEVFSLPSTGRLTADFSADGKKMVVTEKPQEATIWDLTDKSRKAVITEKDKICAVAFSPRGDRVAVFDSVIHIYDAAGNRIAGIEPIDLQIGCGDSLQFSADGKYLLVNLWGRVHLVEVDSGSKISTLYGLEAMVQSVHFSPDYKFIAAIGHDRQLIYRFVVPGNIDQFSITRSVAVK